MPAEKKADLRIILIISSHSDTKVEKPADFEKRSEIVPHSDIKSAILISNRKKSLGWFTLTATGTVLLRCNFNSK